MNKPRTRKVKLTTSPEVEASSYSLQVVVSVSGWSGNTQMKCRGELSMYCAARLVRELRRAMRKVRDEQTAALASAVERAEGPL